jgi:ribosome assembly protein 1
MSAAERTDDAPSLAEDPRRVRNTCILAHVDHGKTTLADHLVASCGDGLLHPKLAGRLRFMDYLDEEQRRAITMKSAAVALRSRAGHRVSLIDSPGHIDFCSEVSSAARLSDSALILVDAVEGVHIQTHAALRQAFVERLRPCLVLNKLDRLITELNLTPAEAYAKLHRIVSDVNSIYSALRSHSYFSLLSALEDNPASSSSSSIEDLPEDFEDDEDEEDAFQPLKGNVIFACALDGWGFRPQQFADLYAKKFKLNASAFLRGLWGPRYYDKGTKRVVGKRAMKTADPQPMFVEYVLNPLWKLYQRVLTEGGESEHVQGLIRNFNLEIPKRDLQNKDPKMVLQSVMSRWLPLADAVMDMVVECTPDPVSAQAARVVRLMPKREVAPEDAACCPEVVAEAERVRRCVEACDVGSDAPVVVYVSKMFAVPCKTLPLKGVNGELLNHNSAIESEECFMAFARVFSGVLRAGQKAFVLSPLYDPVKGDTTEKHLQEVELQYLYEMLGQGLKPVASVGAGNVVAIQGLGQHILKSATLSSTKNCWPFSSMMFQASPMLKVAIEPSNPSDLGSLVKGLKFLNRADPFVEYNVSQRGEHVLAAAGEIHLERCIKDLEERFAKVKLVVSDPLVSFRETVEGEGAGLIESLKVPQDIVERTTPNSRCTVRVQVLRIPNALTKVLEESEQLLGQIIDGKTAKRDGVLDPRLSQDDGDSASALRQRMISAIDSELEAISNQVDKEKLERYRKAWLGYLQRIWSLGPWQVGPNLLLVPDVKSSDGVITTQDRRQGVLVRGRSHVSERLGFVNESDAEANNYLENSKSAADASESLHLESMALRNSIVSGFQIATNTGPLCDEPMWGVAFIVEPYIFADSSDTANHPDQYNLFSGQVITAVKEACRAAVLQNNPRLVEAFYFCELTTPTEQLGSTYAVLGKRRARILKEEMQEGTSLFTVHAYLPVAESVGFSNHLRSITAGAVSALLVLSHWEGIPQDPFFVPKTQDEIEEFGDGSSIGPNLAKKLLNSVRRRKGLYVDEKVVEHGTKQRTLAKKV